MQVRQLQPTRWLAKRLGLSTSTIERLRSRGGGDLPPHVVVGHSIRYDEAVVDEWIAERLLSCACAPEPAAQARRFGNRVVAAAA